MLQSVAQLSSMLPLPSYLFGIYFYSLVGVGENALLTDSEERDELTALHGHQLSLNLLALFPSWNMAAQWAFFGSTY